jgi:uncharacterized membrane protein YkgB
LENLLPNLELNSQDLLLGNHFLRQNPEFPDLIFSGSDHEQNEQKNLTAETKTKPENSESASKTTKYYVVHIYIIIITRILRVLHIAIHCPLPAAKIRGPKILEVSPCCD